MTAERWWLLGLLAFLAMRSCMGEPVHAQDDERTAWAVVVVTTHEAGLDSLADADGIHAALVHGAERHGMSPHAFARAYSPRLFGGVTSRSWVLGMRLDCRRPRDFRLPWSAPRGGMPSRRDACTALVAHVRELVAAGPRCDADDWSAPWVELGSWLVPVDCGDTANQFARRLR